jgi:hypothetical protein
MNITLSHLQCNTSFLLLLTKPLNFAFLTCVVCACKLGTYCRKLIGTTMAATLPPQSSEQRFSISNIISRFRSKKRTSPKKPDAPSQQQIVQQDARPPLNPAPLPLVLPEHQPTLSNLGWTTITFPSSAPPLIPPSPESDFLPPAPGPHPLQTAYEQLFTASQAFFAQPASQKAQWKHRLGSEEGWSSIPGEKEFITLRTLAYCPEVLRDPAKRYWDLVGKHCENTLARIETSLGLPALSSESEGLLRQFVGSCAWMQQEEKEKTATMLRLFRYEGWEAKVVAEPHADLGLLSVVVGDVPGLEVWDGQTWFAVEKEVNRAGQRGATMLGGRQLERLSNGRFPAGGHRVVAYGSSKPQPQPLSSSTPGEESSAAAVLEKVGEEKHYRYSIVFVLRAHEPVIINSDTLETAVTGKWAEPMNGVAAGKFFEKIRGQHFNINVEISEREKQRSKMKMIQGAGKEGDGMSSG